MNFPRTLSIALIVALAPLMAQAQSANIALGTTTFDTAQPVEVSADELSVDQANGQAVFNGNVLVVQGDIRLTAERILVVYSRGNDGAASGIDRLEAGGGVTFVTATDSAEALEAVYSITDGSVTLSGDVLLTQGQNAISGEKLIVDLAEGSGRMEGRVRTVFGAGGDN